MSQGANKAAPTALDVVPIAPKVAAICTSQEEEEEEEEEEKEEEEEEEEEREGGGRGYQGETIEVAEAEQNLECRSETVFWFRHPRRMQATSLKDVHERRGRRKWRAYCESQHAGGKLNEQRKQHAQE
jgi:hypothetical protein